IPTDEEQATGLEKVIMNAMKEGAVSVTGSRTGTLHLKAAQSCDSCSPASSAADSQSWKQLKTYSAGF
ncbi:hypothetical protein XENORESO_002194, partial [Xenotaenia resolanae]